MKNNSSYSNIFKTTFLFGFVQIFNILVKVVLNKTVAILIGAAGMGIIGIYNSAIHMIKSGAGLGISQSAVRDISEANAQNDFGKFSKIISVTNSVIIFTSALGVITTIFLSPFLSNWSFGDYSYTSGFMLISIVVGLNILTDGQLAILKGMRQLRALAKASMFGAIVGLFTAVPFYYFIGKDGIIPSLIISALSALFFSSYYVRKISYKRIKLKAKEIFNESKSMVSMGVALMLVSFFVTIFDMIISAYISKTGSLSDVGFYHAGAAIISSYFGVIITAMSTDYYPRISAVHNDNLKLKEEMDRQSETGLIMIFPLVILFVFLSPFFIDILYSNEFQPTNDYTDYAMIGTEIIIVSNCMGMILLAKQAARVFISSVLFQRIILVAVYLFSYTHYGLLGLGLSYIASGVIHITVVTFILRHFYDIRLARRIYLLLLFVISTTLVTVFIRTFDNVYIKYLSGSVVLAASCLFSLFYMKKRMGLNIIKIINKKIRKK